MIIFIYSSYTTVRQIFIRVANPHLRWYWAGTGLVLGWYIAGATSYHPHMILVSSSCVYEDAQALYQS